MVFGFFLLVLRGGRGSVRWEGDSTDVEVALLTMREGSSSVLNVNDEESFSSLCNRYSYIYISMSRIHTQPKILSMCIAISKIYIYLIHACVHCTHKCTCTCIMALESYRCKHNFTCTCNIHNILFVYMI